MASNISEVNKQILTVKPPSKETWLDWKWNVESAISNSNVWNDIMVPVAGVYPVEPIPAIPGAPTAVETVHIRIFREQSTQAARWLKQAAGRHNDDITRPHVSAGTPVALWQALEAHFEPKGISEQISAFVGLSKTLKSDDEKWITYFQRQDDMASRFLALFPTTLTIANIKDLILMITTLQQLPGDNPTRLMLETNPALSNEVVRNAIKQYIASHSGEEPPTEIAARASTSSGGGGGGNCFLCKHPHYLSSCKFFPYYVELFEKERQDRTGYFALTPAQQLAYQNKAYANHPYASGSSRRGRGGRGRGRGSKANVATMDTTVDAPPLHEESAGNASLSNCPPVHSADRWIADTGASISMTYRREWLQGMKLERRRIRLADGNTVYSVGIGFVWFTPHLSTGDGSAFKIHNVLYVPDLRTNLLSVFSLTRNQGFHASIDDKSIIFWKKGVEIFHGGLSDNNTAFLDVTTERFEAASATFSAADEGVISIDTWHKRFAHRSFHMLEKLRGSNAVEGFKVSPEKPSSHKCVSCIEGKLSRAPHTQLATRATRPLERIFTDVHGPLLRSREGFEYWVTFVDQFSGFAALYCLRKKSDTFAAFKQYKAWAENAMNKRIEEWDGEDVRRTLGVLRDDKGGEYSSTEFDNFLRDNGIQRERTIKDTPQQNGIAERLNRTIDEGITAMLSQSKLPRNMWADAAKTLIYIHNRSPSNTRGFKTPYELWAGKLPSVSHLRTWGCLAYVHIQKSDRPQLSPHAKPCVFIGYAPEQKAYIFYDTGSSRTVTSDSAVFFEDTFPGTLRGRPDPKTLDTSFDTSPEPNIPTFHLTPPIEPPPPPPPRPLVPPHPIVTRPPPIIPHSIPLPDSPAPEDQLPSVTDQGSTLRVRLPGRYHPDDPASVRQESEKEASGSRQVKGLTNREHFSSGYPEEGLPRLRNRAPQGNAAFWVEDEDEEVEEKVPDIFALRAIGDHQVESTPEPHYAWTKAILPPPKGESPNSKAATSARVTPQPPRKVATSAMVALDDAIDFALFTSNTLEPTSLAEARSRPDGDRWIEAALEEIRAHLDNGTWELVRLPHGKHAIGSRWVFKIKKNTDGSVDRYKGRLVAKGYAQKHGVDYTDTFAPTARFAALRTVIALAAIEDWELESVDISTAFLNGDIDTDVYMKIPEGVEIEGVQGSEWVLKLLKGLYGIKQGPRIWSKKLNDELSKLGFTRLECDHSVFLFERDDVKLIVPVHVDDLVIASKSKRAIEVFKNELSKVFKIRDLGPTSVILNIKLERDRTKRTITLNQTHYIDSIISEYVSSEVFNGCDVPLTGQLSVKDCPANPKEEALMAKIPYREVVGKLLYLAIASRPDISLAVGILCRYLEKPGPKHWAAVKHLLRYIKSTRLLKLHYGPSEVDAPFVTHCDADLGGNPDNSRSTAGYCISVGSGVVMWGSRLQRHTSLSSTESEYTTASATGCELMWMRYFFEEIGYNMSKPSTLWMDNASAIQVAKNPEHVSTMKHVHRSYNWIRERVEEGDIRLGHVPGVDNVADIFTKPLARPIFIRFREMLGLRE